MTIDRLTPRQMDAACRAWEFGGSLALGQWAAKNLRPLSVRTYGELVQAVRTELGDDTDYTALAPRPEVHQP